MARLSRFKVVEEDAWYHLYSRVAGVRDDYVLSNPLVQRELCMITDLAENKILPTL